jgi:hypothetical protein
LDDSKRQHDQDTNKTENDDNLFPSFQFGKRSDDIAGHDHEDKYGGKKEGKNDDGNGHFDVHKRLKTSIDLTRQMGQ